MENNEPVKLIAQSYMILTKLHLLVNIYFNQNIEQSSGDIIRKILIFDENCEKWELLMAFQVCGYDLTKYIFAYGFSLFACWIVPLNWNSGGNHPYPPFLTAYLTRPDGGHPDFFHQNDRKGCNIDYLDGLGHTLFGFHAIENHLSGVVNTPLVRRGLSI